MAFRSPDQDSGGARIIHIDDKELRAAEAHRRETREMQERIAAGVEKECAAREALINAAVSEVITDPRIIDQAQSFIRTLEKVAGLKMEEMAEECRTSVTLMKQIKKKGEGLTRAHWELLQRRWEKAIDDEAEKLVARITKGLDPQATRGKTYILNPDGFRSFFEGLGIEPVSLNETCCFSDGKIAYFLRRESRDKKITEGEIRTLAKVSMSARRYL